MQKLNTLTTLIGDIQSKLQSKGIDETKEFTTPTPVVMKKAYDAVY